MMKKQQISAIFWLFSAFLLFSTSASASVLKFPDSEAATVGIMVVDLATGKELQSENKEKAMLPASTMKSITSATALSLRGEDYRFTTDVVITGTVSSGVLNGNVVVKACGDPTICSSHFKGVGGFCESIISALKNEGITEIKGKIIVDESSFKDEGQNPQWAVGDVGWDYGAGLFGFNYYDNIFRLNTATKATSPEIPNLNIQLVRTGKSIDIIRGVDSNNIIVMGSNVGNQGVSVTSTMSDPGAVFVNEMKKKLASNNIKISNNSVKATGEKIIYTRKSPTLGEIMRSLMVRSDNMFAEATLRTVAPRNSRDEAINTELRHWSSKGVNIHGVKIYDGSGLARADRVTPQFMAGVLSSMAKDAKGSTYLSFFPRVGREGTVKSLLAKTKLEGKLALKSGSVNGVQCFAGYKLDANGKPSHVVVVMVNNFFCSRDQVRAAIERWLLETF